MSLLSRLLKARDIAPVKYKNGRISPKDDMRHLPAQFNALWLRVAALEKLAKKHTK